ncbi:MAG: TonB-dependent vitamin B12 receptor BtuB [Halioglobus sp.]
MYRDERETMLKQSLFALALLGGAVNAAADAPPEELVVTGSYAPESAITASLSVLDDADIAAANKRSLAGLLQTLPGLLVEEQGGPGGLTAISVRGGEPNFTLVLLDGVAVNDPTNSRGGGFDFANLNPALVERIEVVRGAQSAVYGSDAVAGVINIITRRPQVGHRQSVTLEAGEDDYRDIRLDARGREGNLDYTVALASRDAGEPLPGSSRDSDSANLRLEWRPGFRHAFNLGLRYLEGDRTSYPEQSGGPLLAQSDELDRADYRDTVYSARWRMAVNERWRSDLLASHFEHNEDYFSPGIPPFFEVPPNGAETDFERSEVRWVNSLDAAPGLRVDLGADYRREQGDSDSYVEFGGQPTPTDFELDRDISALFSNATFQPRDALLLNASVRRDNPDDFPGETTWRLGGSLGAGAGITLDANWGEAYKLPSFFALGHALVGNPDLQPERNRGWDASVRWQGAGQLQLAATYFANDFSDLIDFDEASFRNVNRRSVETSGVELTLDWALSDTLSLRANGTYTDIDLKGEDSVLTGRPEWVAGLLARWRPAAAWESVLDYRFTGEQWSTSRHTGEAVSEQLDTYHRVDWVLSWAPSPRWQTRLSIDNLLDETYQTAVGFEAPGRALRLGLTFVH